jgi:hypothetical protein
MLMQESAAPENMVPLTFFRDSQSKNHGAVHGAQGAALKVL